MTNKHFPYDFERILKGYLHLYLLGDSKHARSKANNGHAG